MDPAEIRFIWWVFIEERGAEIFRKIYTSPILWELLKFRATPFFFIGYLETIANGAYSSVSGLLLTTVNSGNFVSLQTLIGFFLQKSFW